MKKVFSTVDGHKYVRSKISEKYIYLKCALLGMVAKEPESSIMRQI